MKAAPAKIESAIARLEALEDASARAAARDAVVAVLAFHGEGARRLVERLRETAPDGDRLIEALARDELIGSLLALHDVHPLSLESRVRRAVDRMYASMRQEGGRIEIVSVTDAIVRLRVTGSEHSRRAVTRAVTEACPEVERVDVLGPDPSLVSIGRVASKRREAHARCDLCGQPLASKHEHVFDIEHRRLECACIACGVLFDTDGSKVRRVRPRAVDLDGFRITEAQWTALGVPVGLAFFSYSSSMGEVIAAYPGPAGAIESFVSKPAWEDLVADNRLLEELEPDTAALLVDRLSATPRYYILSIDACYRLTGIVRSRWQGLTGGEGPVRAVDEFFAGLSEGLR